jgi:hypothetical protein
MTHNFHTLTASPLNVNKVSRASSGTWIAVNIAANAEQYSFRAETSRGLRAFDRFAWRVHARLSRQSPALERHVLAG